MLLRHIWYTLRCLSAIPCSFLSHYLFSVLEQFAISLWNLILYSTSFLTSNSFVSLHVSCVPNLCFHLPVHYSFLVCHSSFRVIRDLFEARELGLLWAFDCQSISCGSFVQIATNLHFSMLLQKFWGSQLDFKFKRYFVCAMLVIIYFLV